MPVHGDGGSYAHHKSLLGPHELDDPDVIEYQILTAWATHLDGFILNPTHFSGRDYDLNIRTLQIIDKICELNQKRPDFNFSYIFSYDDNGIAKGDVSKRSNEIVAEKNNMGVKTVQRFIALNNLVPDMLKLADEKKLPFMAGVEMSYIKPKLQEYIAMTIETEGSPPTQAQAARMRELDAKGALNTDVIDGIMLEEKKEDRKVIISSQELEKYFGLEKSPKEMKETIMKLLAEYKEKNPLELDKASKTKDGPSK
jgi:hypothetical protein